MTVAAAYPQRRSWWRLYAPFLPLLLVCLGPLAFVLAKTSALERDMRIAVTENMLWVVTQTQMEVMALTIAAGAPDLAAETLNQRYDLTLSRLNLLQQGPQARYLAQLDHDGAVDRMADDLLTLDPVEHEDTPALRRALFELGQELHPKLNRVANDVMTREWDMSAARLDEYRASQRLIILAVAFAFLGALALSGLLLHNQSRLHRAELQRLNAAALLKKERDTSAMYRDFAAMVSHQMRTPLTLIDSAMHRLVRKGDAVSARDVAERQGVVHDAVRRLTRLVEAVLLLGKLDNNQLEGTLAPVALDRLAEAVVSEASARHPERTVKLSRADRDLMAQCDPHLVTHVLDNLLSNALKYSPDARPVELRVFAQGSRVACAVTDEGPGIVPEDQARVFERYFRGRAHQAGPGTGLGLAVARELAEAQGGEVTVESWPGRGSVFTLWMPRAERGQSHDHG